MAKKPKKPRVNRTEDLFVRLTPEEKALISEAAQASGKSLSKFVREVACWQAKAIKEASGNG